MVNFEYISAGTYICRYALGVCTNARQKQLGAVKKGTAKQRVLSGT